MKITNFVYCREMYKKFNIRGRFSEETVIQTVFIGRFQTSANIPRTLYSLIWLIHFKYIKSLNSSWENIASKLFKKKPSVQKSPSSGPKKGTGDTLLTSTQASNYMVIYKETKFFVSMNGY